MPVQAARGAATQTQNPSETVPCPTLPVSPSFPRWRSVSRALAFGQVHASGFQLRENSVKNLGRGQAGTAVANGDASVVSNNPGAMGFIDQNTVQADVTVIDLTADFSGNAYTHLAAGAPCPSAGCIPVSGGNGGDPAPRLRCRRSPRCSRCMARSRS